MKEREIAKKLSAQGIPTPFTRRCQLGYLKNTLRVKDPAWQTVFVTKVLENPIYTGTMVYNRIAYDETNRKIGQNPRESWRMVPDSHPAIISWELFDEVSALREAEQAVKEERKKWCRQRRKEQSEHFSKAESFAKSAEKKWFVIGKVMVRCIFTVHLAMFPSQRKTSGTALTRSCTSGWKNTVICRSWYGKALEKSKLQSKRNSYKT